MFVKTYGWINLGFPLKIVLYCGLDDANGAARVAELLSHFHYQSHAQLLPYF